MGNTRDRTALLWRGPKRPKRPEVPEEKITRWRAEVDSMAEKLGVPVGLINKAEFQKMIVLASAETGSNPFKIGDKTLMHSGLYCETVMARRQELVIRNAVEDPDWRDGLDVELGFISYIGLPLQWPDGEMFGTLCVLDRKENEFPGSARELMGEIKKTIESDLAALQE